MKKSVNGWTFPKDMPLADRIKAASEAGFEAFEPTMEEQGELSLATDESACRKLGDQIREGGLEVASLATGLFWKYSLTSPDPATRSKAYEVVITGLDRARWLGTDAYLIVPGLVSNPKTHQLECGYEEALKYAFDALGKLAFEAESRGVVIAMENVWNQFLVSPVEMREFIDQINSPWVGAYLDVGNVLRYGVAEDWVNVLGKRVSRIHLKDFKLDVGSREGFCPLLEGDVHWQEVVAALQYIGYDGPMTYEGPGDPKDICQRVEKILAYCK